MIALRQNATARLIAACSIDIIVTDHLLAVFVVHRSVRASARRPATARRLVLRIDGSASAEVSPADSTLPRQLRPACAGAEPPSAQKHRPPRPRRNGGKAAAR